MRPTSLKSPTTTLSSGSDWGYSLKVNYHIYAGKVITTKKLRQLTRPPSKKVKSLQFDRYKIVVDVSIGSKACSPPGTVIASQGLWNSTTDGFASAAFVNDQLFAVAAVYAVYTE